MVLKLKVKQGEEISYGFTVRGKVYNQETEKYELQPLDLSNYNIKFQVKLAPLEKAKVLVDKLITTDSDELVDGRIYDATNGQFYVHLTKEDTSYNTSEYALVISLVSPNNDDIISSNCCTGAEYIICEQ